MKLSFFNTKITILAIVGALLGCLFFSAWLLFINKMGSNDISRYSCESALNYRYQRNEDIFHLQASIGVVSLDRQQAIISISGTITRENLKGRILDKINVLRSVNYSIMPKNREKKLYALRSQNLIISPLDTLSRSPDIAATVIPSLWLTKDAESFQKIVYLSPKAIMYSSLFTPSFICMIHR